MNMAVVQYAAGDGEGKLVEATLRIWYDEDDGHIRLKLSDGGEDLTPVCNKPSQMKRHHPTSQRSSPAFSPAKMPRTRTCRSWMVSCHGHMRPLHPHPDIPELRHSCEARCSESDYPFMRSPDCRIGKLPDGFTPGKDVSDARQGIFVICKCGEEFHVRAPSPSGTCAICLTVAALPAPQWREHTERRPLPMTAKFVEFKRYDMDPARTSPVGVNPNHVASVVPVDENTCALCMDFKGPEGLIMTYKVVGSFQFVMDTLNSSG